MPTWVNMLVRTYAWMGILQDEGIFNTILSWFGIGPVSMIHTSFAVILGMVYNFIPFMILQIHTSLAKMDKSLLEAANDLGATPVQAFFKVIVPDIFPGILSGFLMAFTMSLDDFTITYFTKGAGIKTLSIIIYTERKLGNQPELYALSTIIFLIVLIVLFAVNRISINKEKSAAKGKNY